MLLKDVFRNVNALWGFTSPLYNAPKCATQKTGMEGDKEGSFHNYKHHLYYLRKSIQKICWEETHESIRFAPEP